MFNISHIKQDFTIFRHNPELIFADNASTTHKPCVVIDAISNFYKHSNSNILRAVYDLGVNADEVYKSCKKALCRFYEKETAIFTSGTTDGFNKLARSLEGLVNEGDNIIVSEMEHHSNLIPWQELCRRKNAVLRIVRITEKGELDLDHFEDLIDARSKIVSLVHISNTLGTINDLKSVAEILNKRDCIFLVDAAQSCALHRDEIRMIDADAVVFGAHKMFGPSGIGVILAKNRLLKKLTPFNYGGGMVTEVNEQMSTYRDDLSRFEGGTPPLAQVAGLRTALVYLEGLDLGQCISHSRQLAAELRRKLEDINVHCLGSSKTTAGILSATFGEIHPHDVATFLNSKDIAVRAGHHCTQLIMKKYQIHSSIRFSFSIYNEQNEIARIVNAIKEMKTYFA